MKTNTLQIHWNRKVSHDVAISGTRTVKNLTKAVRKMFRKKSTTIESMRCNSIEAAYSIVGKRNLENIDKVIVHLPDMHCMIVKNGKLLNPPKSIHE